MYGIFAYIWHEFMPNVGEYSIHGSYGKDSPTNGLNDQTMETPILSVMCFFHWKFMSRLYEKKHVDFLRNFRFSSEKKTFESRTNSGENFILDPPRLICSFLLSGVSVTGCSPSWSEYLQHHRKKTTKILPQTRDFATEKQSQKFGKMTWET